MAFVLTHAKVHRNILVGRSAWFKKAFNGQFKVLTHSLCSLCRTCRC